jgi:hypothetical protein
MEGDDVKPLILVFDDEEPSVELYAEKLRPFAEAHGYEVSLKGPNPLLQELKRLEERRRKARDGESTPGDDCELDAASIVVVDYDLLRLPGESYISGENFAYLARCYSRCGYIIALNQYLEVDFDLTLGDDLCSFADLNINDNLLSAGGLWDNDWVGVRPWHWPLLPACVKAIENRIAALSKPEALDTSILETLNLVSVADALPRAATQFLCAAEQSAATVTFREFVSGSGNGLRGKDEPLGDGSVIRIASARLSKWLERLVLPAQDVLVDAPHLVSRFPSLIKSDKSPPDTADWDRTARLAAAAELGVDADRINEHRVELGPWLSREAWFWSGVSMSDKIDEIRDPWPAKSPGLVFCEDYSRFVPREEAREFVADIA